MRAKCPGGRWSRRERGAVLVEMSIVTMFLVVLTMGIVEFGLYLKQTDDVAGAIRSGARAGAAAGNSPNADYRILTAMKTSKNGLAGKIDRVVVFNASATTNPPQSCLDGTPSANCSVYNAADFDKTEPELINMAAAAGWKPANRVEGVDYVGVRARADHVWVTKFFGADHKFGDSSIVRLAKGGSGSSSPGASGPFGSDIDIPPSWNPSYIAPFGNCEDTGGCGGGSGGGGGSY